MTPSLPQIVEIVPGVGIPAAELTFTFSRSSGPGGQNVNKVESRVTLRFQVASSSALDSEQKERIATRLATRIDKAGWLRVSSQRFRTQVANRNATIERFAELLAWALGEEPPRHPTRVPRTSRRRRLEEKRKRGRVKHLRGKPSWEA